MHVLEWGSGGSTLFLSKYAGSWRSIEHDRAVAKDVVAHLNRTGSANVTLVHLSMESGARLDGPFAPHEDFKSYIEASRMHSKSTYDLIFIDGAARIACAEYVLRAGLLKARDQSRLIVHDFDWVQLWTGLRPHFVVSALD